MNNEPMSVGEWVVTLIILSIPIVGFIMLIYWAVADSNVNRKNFCVAGIVISVIWTIIFLVIVSMGLLAGMMGGVGM